MKIIAFDPGRTSAFIVIDNEKVVYKAVELKKTTLLGLYRIMRDAMIEHKPSAIVHGLPVQYRQVIAFQSKQIGIAELLAEEFDIHTVPTFDNQARKKVMNKGNATKEEVMARYKIDSEHLADCHLFAENFFMFQ